MFKNLRRSTREDDYLPITVSAQNGNTGEVLTDIFPCHIINISSLGACLFITRVMEGSFHIFHSVRENKDLLLQLQLVLPPDDKTITLTALPAWLNLFQNNKGFKMGIKFTPSAETHMEQIQASLRTHQKERCKQFHV